ncbi:MAG: pilus assembly protein TadG-related protein [Alphaproteobacteria bacterium]|nr:pilus assembly protein TadG-related protein [Alphaproteobacteria bacterium]
MPSSQTITKVLRQFGVFYSDKRGVSAVLLALIMPALIGFVGLGIDAAMWYSRKNEIQSAADSAAISAALTYLANNDEGAAVQMGASDAARSGFDSGNGTVNVNIGDGGAAEVLLSEPQPMFFSSIFLSQPVTVSARAVASPLTTSDSTGTYCMLGLDTSLDNVVEFIGSSQAQIKCGVASNSNSSSSLYLNGNAQLQIDPGDLSVKGQITKQGSAQLNTVNPPLLGGGGKDPYTELTVPSGVCDHNNFTVNNRSNQTLNPGRYCNGLKLRNASNVTFSPGIYIIDGGEFASSLSTSAQGNGVTFILTGSGTNYATLHFSGSSQMTFTAPGSGAYKGVLFYQDRNSPSFIGGSQNLIKNQLVGNTHVYFSGAMYFPAQELSYAGSAQLQSDTSCLQIIARKITFLGDSQIQSELCEGAQAGDVSPIFRETQMVRLVE